MHVHGFELSSGGATLGELATSVMEVRTAMMDVKRISERGLGRLLFLVLARF
jgi:hypothetical protein